jgi:alpha-tubulin suppressor-like RCC1 family protein
VRRRDGTVLCWGSNEYGQLGDGTLESRDIPTPVEGLTSAAQLAVLDYQTCARLVDGTVACWGLGWSSQPVLMPDVVPGLSDVVDIAAGSYHVCVVRQDHAVLCWGGNDHGQLGIGSNASEQYPVQVTFPMEEAM